MSRDDRLNLGLFVHTYGYTPTGWVHPSVAGARATDFGHMARIAKRAEDLLLDFFFLADSAAIIQGDPVGLSRQPNKVDRFEPITLLAALSTVTERIGLAATASTSFYEPYNIARLFQSVDHLSGGRAVWNVVTSDHDEVGYNYGNIGLPPHAERYARAEEFVDVVLGLWDTWEPDAIINDPANAKYHDETKLHALNHVGERFRVRGPLNISASPQVHPVIAQAGASEPGKQLAARTAEIVFGAGLSLEESKAFYADVKGRMPGFGRDPKDLRILPGLRLTVGETLEAARAQLDWLVEHTHPEIGRVMVGEFLEADLTGLPLDQPIPEDRIPAEAKGSKVLFQQIKDFVSQGQSLGEIIRHYVANGLGNGIVGTPATVADYMEEWFEEKAADGFIVMPAVLPAGLDDLALLVPELQRRGLFREEYTGATLRENLGIGVAPNRFALQRA